MGLPAYCVTVFLFLTPFSFKHVFARKERPPCPGKHSVWDKWYDGCNWCVCTDNGPVCTDKSCYRIPVDQCESLGQKWRDGCYRCQCKESGIVCTADHRCVHAMRHRPFPCVPRLGCVCGIDGLPSCVADSQRLAELSQGYQKRLNDNKYVSNVPHWSKDRYIALTQRMTCRDAKRWYSGTRRCFCEDGTREAACGEPRHIAHRVDGFRFKIAQCYTNQNWNYNCRKCNCHMYGFGFCVRIPNCKRTSLQTNENVSLRKECRDGSRWRDGCKSCTCYANNKIICDNSGCNLSGHIAETEVKVNIPSIILGETDIQLTGAGKSKEQKEATTVPSKDKTILRNLPRFQIPPPHSFNMVRSFRNHKQPQAVQLPTRCEGKYKPGETYYVKCNFCECTHTGDSKCTAILCV